MPCAIHEASTTEPRHVFVELREECVGAGEPSLGEVDPAVAIEVRARWLCSGQPRLSRSEERERERVAVHEHDSSEAYEHTFVNSLANTARETRSRLRVWP